MRHLGAKSTTLVSVDALGHPFPADVWSISNNGRFVVMSTDVQVLPGDPAATHLLLLDQPQSRKHRLYVYDTYMSETLTGRLNFRVTSEQERALRDAAALSGQSVSGFVLSSAVERAHELLARANAIELSDAAFRKFVAALDEPAEAVPELIRLFKRNSRVPTR